MEPRSESDRFAEDLLPYHYVESNQQDALARRLLDLTTTLPIYIRSPASQIHELERSDDPKVRALAGELKHCLPLLDGLETDRDRCATVLDRLARHRDFRDEVAECERAGLGGRLRIRWRRPRPSARPWRRHQPPWRGAQTFESVIDLCVVNGSSTRFYCVDVGQRLREVDTTTGDTITVTGWEDEGVKKLDAARRRPVALAVATLDGSTDLSQEWVAIGRADGSVLLRNFTTGGIQHFPGPPQPPPPPPPQQAPPPTATRSVEFTADRERLVILYSTGQIRVWQWRDSVRNPGPVPESAWWDTGEPKWEDRPDLVALSPDGLWMATGRTWGQTVTLWDLRVRRVVRQFTGLRGVPSLVDLSFIGDLLFAHGFHSHTVKVWDTAGRSIGTFLDVESNAVLFPDDSTVTWVVGDEKLASESITGVQHPLSRAFHLVRRALQVRPRRAADPVGTHRLITVDGGAKLAWFSDWRTTGPVITTWCTVDVVDRRGEVVDHFEGGGSWSHAATRSDGGFHFVLEERTVIVWTAGEGSHFETFPKSEGRYGSHAVSGSGRTIAAGDSLGQVTLIDVDRIGEDGQDDDPEVGGLRCRGHAVDPRGRWVASMNVNRQVLVFRPSDGHLVHHLDGRFTGVFHNTTGRTTVLSPGGDWIAFADDDGTVRVHDPVTSAELVVLPGNKGELITAGSEPTPWLVVAERDGPLTVWDLTDWTPSSRILTGHTAPVERTATTSTGRHLVTQSRRELCVWDLDAPRSDPLSSCPVAERSLVGVDPRGRWWIAHSRPTGTLQVRSLEGDDLVRVLAEDVEGIGCGAVSHVGDLLVVVDNTGRKRAWNPVTGDVIGDRARRDAVGDREHGDGVLTACAIDPTGRWFADVHVDGTVRVEPTASTGPTYAIRTGHALHGCQWLPDSSGVLVVGIEGTAVYTWSPEANPQATGDPDRV